MFAVEEGNVWVDPEGTAWKVKHLGPFTTHLERTAVTHVDTRDMVRTWRQMNDTHPDHTYPTAPQHTPVGSPTDL